MVYLSYVSNLRQKIAKEFGTERGLIRYLLAKFEYYIGSINEFKNTDLSNVNRVVFVCLGNICRSAYAHQFANLCHTNFEIASLGLSTTTGVSANSIAKKIALESGVDMEIHRTTDFNDFTVKPGDLFLAMEIRQAKQLKNKLGSAADHQIALLGNWANPKHTHIHDPHTLSEDYFRTCFEIIKDSVNNLIQEINSVKN